MADPHPYALDTAVEQFLARSHGLFIDGKIVKAASDKQVPVYDPARGTVIAQVPDASAADVDRAVQSAHAAFKDGRWRNQRPADRERILLKLADLLQEKGEALAQLETLEQGKSINISRMIEVGGAVEWARFAAGLTTKLTGRTFDISLPGGPNNWTAYTRREPVGVVAAIAPWNFPLMIAIWKVIPALAAGCSVVLKPSEVTPLSALMLAELGHEAGLPPGVFNVVTGLGSTTGAALTTHPLVAKISFTGSTATGKAINRAATDRLTRVTLELGGKNAALILKDADVAKVTGGLMAGAFLNGGQVCAATSRVYVEAPLYDDLVANLESAIGTMNVGPGMDPQTQVNPLVSASHRDKVKAYLDDARAVGGEVRSNLAIPDEGYYVAPSLILNPSERVRASREEVFGPVLGLIKVASAEEGLALVNDSDLGLAASLWTNDLSMAMDYSRRIEAGTVWINAHIFIDPAMPFGGMKQSGIGRDFGSDWLNAYTEEKAICISH